MNRRVSDRAVAGRHDGGEIVGPERLDRRGRNISRRHDGIRGQDRAIHQDDDQPSFAAIDVVRHHVRRHVVRPHGLGRAGAGGEPTGVNARIGRAVPFSSTVKSAAVSPRPAAAARRAPRHRAESARPRRGTGAGRPAAGPGARRPKARDRDQDESTQTHGCSSAWAGGRNVGRWLAGLGSADRLLTWRGPTRGGGPQMILPCRFC